MRATVTHTFVRTVEAVIAVDVAYPDGAVDTLVGTPNHPFWVPAEGRYVALEELAVGAVLRTVDGGEARVAGKEWRRGEVEVFDVEVQGLHCFYVVGVESESVPGVLVHNSAGSSRIVPGGGLSAHESAGGHLIARHVGKTEADLSARLAAEPNIPAASTFVSRAEAEAASAAVLEARCTQISAWEAAGANGKLVVDAPVRAGMVLERGASSAVTGEGVRLILKSNGSGGWYILTGFATP